MVIGTRPGTLSFAEKSLPKRLSEKGRPFNDTDVRRRKVGYRRRNAHLIPRQRLADWAISSFDIRARAVQRTHLRPALAVTERTQFPAKMHSGLWRGILLIHKVFGAAHLLFFAAQWLQIRPGTVLNAWYMHMRRKSRWTYL